MIIAGKNGKIYLAFLLFINFSANLFSQDLNFKNLSVKNGLSNNKINAILQDKTGFIWFGTEDGLNRFDGYNFKVYRNDPTDSNSISHNNIWAIFADENDNIWIGTKSGVLNLYDRRYDSFRHWTIKSKFVKENSITAIYKDRNNSLWIGTYQSGLFKFNPETGESKSWNYNPEDRNSLSNNFITSIIEDAAGNLWISTYNGLNKFIPSANENYFFRYEYNPLNQNSLNNNLVWSVQQSHFDEKKLWLGTANGLASLDIRTNVITRINLPIAQGLQFSNSVSSVVEEDNDGEKILWMSTYAGVIRMNLNTSEIVRYFSDERNPSSIINNQVNEIIKDKSGVIWCATEGGISYISPKALKFNNPFSSGFSSKMLNDLKAKNVRSVITDSHSDMFFGTDDGVYQLINSTSKSEPIKISSTNQFNVWSLEPGNNHDLWVGTYGQGLKQLSLKNGEIKSWKIESPTFKTTAFDYIKSLRLDENNILWIGFWGGGFSKLNTINGEYEIWISESKKPQSISHNDVWDIHRDRKGRLWLATNGGGLNLFDPEDGGKFLQLIDFKNSELKLSSNSLFTICEKKFSSGTNTNDETVLWIGSSNGLNKLSIKNLTFTGDYKSLECDVEVFNSANGLADNSVKSIVEDNRGNLWIGTNAGISYFDSEKKLFRNYSTSDGLIGSEMNSGSAANSSNGFMFFGSSDGLNIFDPEKITQSTYRPSVVVSDFQIFNQLVKIGDDSPLSESILTAKIINLAYSQNVFSFQFSALDYNDPESIQYTYKMEGFDNDWIISGNRRFITYTNLNPGKYIFKVKATNSDGIWTGNEKSIFVNIGAPWWRTGWAYAMYVIIIFSGIFSIRKIEINRSKLRNELKMREFEAKKQRELENIKSRFFANLSHEFRTPLTLIRGPIEELINGDTADNKEEYYELIKRNSEKLQELIDQLLELTQLENAAIPLKAKKENLVSLARGLLFAFEALAKQKEIKLSFSSSSEKFICWIDRDKLEKIINNLLSNAIKFTPANGDVSINIQYANVDGNKFAVVEVSDSGIGIPEDKLENIFNRFFQVDDSSRKKYKGSGIGLALVKELTDLHKWNISVVSELGKGTIFTLRIPLSDHYLSEDEKVIGSEVYANEETYQSEISEEEKSDELEKEIEEELAEKQKLINAKTSILIVEDSEDVRTYLTSLLKNEFQMNEAVDGEDGIKKAAEFLPDLIISDVMMPAMDGFEFCKKIKTDWLTSHIPVILLTAKANVESKIAGLETGADDYLTKPFSSKELFARVKNLLEQRKILRERFSKEIKVEPASIAVNSIDNEFLEKAFAVAEKNLSNTEFNSEYFAKEMFLSRSQLHRKILAVIGQAPGEFIRTFRLKKAASLILEKRLSITQIAFEVGFSSPSHFTKAFRQQFNCLPTEFTERTKF